MSGGKIKAASAIDKEKLQSELRELRTVREKVIEERKQFDLELKGVNVQVQKKVGCYVNRIYKVVLMVETNISCDMKL